MLHILEFFGFEKAGTSGAEVYGDCIFCGKTNKLYVNEEKEVFECKTCSQSGNKYSLMSKLLRNARTATSDAMYRKLAKNRKLPFEVFKDSGMAYCPLSQSWLIPYFGIDTLSPINLRHWNYTQKGIRSIKGTTNTLYGLETLGNDDTTTVFLCEGEWDAIALSYCCSHSDDEAHNSAAVVAVPGASTFKREWAPYFLGKDVYVLYDADDAGQRGVEKAVEILGQSARSVHVLVWGPEAPSGADIRDLIVNHLERHKSLRSDEFAEIVSEIKARCQKVVAVNSGASTGIELVETLWPSDKDTAPDFETTCSRIQQQIELTPDLKDMLQVCYAHAFSNEMRGDPLWTYVIGPPGSGKTLIMMSLAGSERCIFQSSFTPNALISGFKSGASGHDPSLLPQWNRKVVVLKDFTEILAIHVAAKEEIFGRLRGAYDGVARKEFGNGIVREYKDLYFSMLAGVTPAIHAEKRATLGERFLKYEMRREGEYDAENQILAAIGSIEHETEIINELRDASGEFLSRRMPDSLPVFSTEYTQRVVNLSQFIGALRTDVTRDFSHERIVQYEPVREVGTRLSKQLVKLAKMLAVVHNVNAVDERCWKLVEKTALDTANQFFLRVVMALFHRKGSASSQEIQEATRIPSGTLVRILEDCHILRVLDTTTGSKTGMGRPRKEWALTDSIQHLMKGAGIS